MDEVKELAEWYRVQARHRGVKLPWATCWKMAIWTVRIGRVA